MQQRADTARPEPLDPHEDAPISCEQQVLAQARARRVLAGAMAGPLVIACADPVLRGVVERIAPSLRVHRDGLSLDDDLRRGLSVAIALGVRSVVAVTHTGRYAASFAPEPTRLRGYERLRTNAARTGRRFAEASASLRTFCRDLREQLAAERGGVSCFGVLYVVESGVTHVYAPEADSFAAVE